MGLPIFFRVGGTLGAPFCRNFAPKSRLSVSLSMNLFVLCTSTTRKVCSEYLCPLEFIANVGILGRRIDKIVDARER